MNIDPDRFIQALDAISESLTYDVLLPSIQKTLTFKQLNTQQFNKIIAAYTSNNQHFNKEFVNILQKNLLTEYILLKDINLFDYVYLILDTKKACLADEFTIFFSEDEVINYNLPPSKVYSITEYLETRKDILLVPPLTIETTGFTVTCSLPTIFKEVQTVISPYQDTEKEKYIEYILLATIAKYIDSISIENNVFNFNEHDLNTNIKILERLPSHAISRIIKTIEKIKTPLIQLTTLDIKDKDNNIILQKEIPLLGDLFNF